MHPKSIKKCPNHSRIVPDTEFINNIGTWIFENHYVTAHILCPFTCYLAVESFIWSKENIFYKTENVLPSLQKLKNPISRLSPRKKPMCGVLNYLSTKICLLGFFSSLTWKYLGVWYLIHIHFSVPANFVPYVYLDVFLSNSILFWWISVIYFTFCATLFWLFMWLILKAIGNLCIDILTSAPTA